MSNDNRRQELIQGLRDLAGFLEANPDVPADGRCTYMFHTDGTDEEQRAEVDRIAELIGEDAVDSGTGHYNATKHFGRVEYEVSAIDEATRAVYRSRIHDRKPDTAVA